MKWSFPPISNLERPLGGGKGEWGRLRNCLPFCCGSPSSEARTLTVTKCPSGGERGRGHIQGCVTSKTSAFPPREHCWGDGRQDKAGSSSFSQQHGTIRKGRDQASIEEVRRSTPGLGPGLCRCSQATGRGHGVRSLWAHAKPSGAAGRLDRTPGLPHTSHATCCSCLTSLGPEHIPTGVTQALYTLHAQS